jgi:hypothetical protein
MSEANDVTLLDAVPRRVARKPDSRSSPVWEESPNAPGIRWTTPHHASQKIDQELGTPISGAYDALDLRLMDTFPASDAVARY